MKEKKTGNGKKISVNFKLDRISNGSNRNSFDSKTILFSKNWKMLQHSLCYLSSKTIMCQLFFSLTDLFYSEDRETKKNLSKI